MDVQVRAQARFQRIAPKKVRLVIDVIRKTGVEQAQQQLSLLPKRAASIVRKVLDSAVANAEHNLKLARKDLVVKEAFVDGGPTIKRWRPRAFGRAAMLRKRTSHITVVLSLRPGAAKPGTKSASADDVAGKQKDEKPEQKKRAPRATALPIQQKSGHSKHVSGSSRPTGATKQSVLPQKKG